ncbi:hypothetical protein BKA69DRAFT_1048758 [Paraphysoderma sedebokerense]|nr:hypothetical protein BKA69DRAFT_1048758 [Paraphysoderma sedebokerense]
MSSLKDAIRRLEIIHAACAPKDKKDEETGMDEFTRIKKRIHQNVKQARQLITEREQLSKSKNASSTEIAELSFKIRSILKQVKEESQELQRIVDKAEKKIKGKNKPEIQEVINSRKEIVKLCFMHLEECQNLDNSRFNDKFAADRADLFAGGSALPSKVEFVKFPQGAVGPMNTGSPLTPGNPETELPDIDVAEDLVLIKKYNLDLDKELDEIAAGVAQLKEVAVKMGEEVDKQNAMLDDVEGKIDKAQEHLTTVNMKMKQALDGVMKGDRFLVNCVLICILLALTGYIASKLTE